MAGCGTQSEDSSDIRAFLEGDRDAFNRLVLRHRDRIFNLCYRLLGDFDDANDTAQETFAKAFKAIGQFRSESSFSTWLYTIAVNTCRNRRSSTEFRFWKRILRLDRQDVQEDEGMRMENSVEDPAPSALECITQKEQETFLQSAIDSLPHEQRAVIVLRHIEGLSYEEIARITGYNPGTIKSRLARARAQLQEKLGRD